MPLPSSVNMPARSHASASPPRQPFSSGGIARATRRAGSEFAVGELVRALHEHRAQQRAALAVARVAGRLELGHREPGEVVGAGLVPGEAERAPGEQAREHEAGFGLRPGGAGGGPLGGERAEDGLGHARVMGRGGLGGGMAAHGDEEGQGQEGSTRRRGEPGQDEERALHDTLCISGHAAARGRRGRRGRRAALLHVALRVALRQRRRAALGAGAAAGDDLRGEEGLHDPEDVVRAGRRGAVRRRRRS